LVIEYNTSSILIYDIIYDYTTLFSKTSCVDNVINTKPRFRRIYQQLDLRKNNKQEIYPKNVQNIYIDQLIKEVQPLSSLVPYSCSHTHYNVTSSKIFVNIDEQSFESPITK